MKPLRSGTAIVERVQDIRKKSKRCTTPSSLALKHSWRSASRCRPSEVPACSLRRCFCACSSKRISHRRVLKFWTMADPKPSHSTRRPSHHLVLRPSAISVAGLSQTRSIQATIFRTRYLSLQTQQTSRQSLLSSLPYILVMLAHSQWQALRILHLVRIQDQMWMLVLRRLLKHNKEVRSACLQYPQSQQTSWAVAQRKDPKPRKEACR